MAGDALVVLEAGQPAHAEFRVDVGHDLAHAAVLAPAAGDVQDAQALDGLALDAAELGADHLVARAHGEDHGAAGRGGLQAAVGGQPPGGQDLRQVLAAAHQVDVAVGRDGLVGVDLDGLDGDAAQLGPALQDQQVAAVAVGAQQVRVDPDQPELAVGARGGVPRPVLGHQEVLTVVTRANPAARGARAPRPGPCTPRSLGPATSVRICWKAV